MDQKTDRISAELIDFLDRSPNAFFAVDNMKRMLAEAGFRELKECERWHPEPGRGYYVTRNGSALIAFRMPERPFRGYQIMASHCDSPAFRVKTKAGMESGAYVKLNVERYGGMILSTWLDRPLSLAGRVLVDTGSGVESRLVNIDRDLLIIPSLAIHMNREANDGYRWNPQTDLLPLLGMAENGRTVEELAARELGIDADTILDMDLMLYNRMRGTVLGADGEFSDQNLQTVGRKSGELHQVVEYTCKDGLNEYTPTLCIFGFQYVLVETDLPIDGSEFTAHAVYFDMDETASFTCDHALVNQPFRNAVWSEKSNFVDIPTDCPQRERSGWTGDAGLYCHTGIRLMDAYPVYARWLAECRVDQYPDGKVCNISPRRTAKPSFFDTLYDGSCAWGDAAVIVPYDALALILDRKLPKLPYFWCRILCDGSCALICFLAGGIVGLGTLVSAFGFGPVIAFFNKTVSEPLCKT